MSFSAIPAKSVKVINPRMLWLILLENACLNPERCYNECLDHGVTKFRINGVGREIEVRKSETWLGATEFHNPEFFKES